MQDSHSNSKAQNLTFGKHFAEEDKETFDTPENHHPQSMME